MRFNPIKLAESIFILVASNFLVLYFFPDFSNIFMWISGVFALIVVIAEVRELFRWSRYSDRFPARSAAQKGGYMGFYVILAMLGAVWFIFTA